MFLPDYPNTLTCPITRIEILSRMPDWSSLPDYPNTLVCPTSRLQLFTRPPEWSVLPECSPPPSMPTNKPTRAYPNAKLHPISNSVLLFSPWDIPEPPT